MSAQQQGEQSTGTHGGANYELSFGRERTDAGGGGRLRRLRSRGSERGSRGTGDAGAICALLTGVSVGAALMYLFDPDQGRRRRALLRDKVVGATNTAGDALGKTARDLSNRAQGLVAETSSALGRPWKHQRESGAGQASEGQQASAAS